LAITGKNVPKEALAGADIKKLTGKDVTEGVRPAGPLAPAFVGDCGRPGFGGWRARGSSNSIAGSARPALSLLHLRSSVASGGRTTRRAAPRRPRLKTRGPA
jgi:hypothetical protein